MSGRAVCVFCVLEVFRQLDTGEVILMLTEFYF